MTVAEAHDAEQALDVPALVRQGLSDTIVEEFWFPDRPAQQAAAT